jgi:hypothetical protein
LPSTRRGHPNGIGGDRRRLRRTVHHGLESLSTIDGILSLDPPADELTRSGSRCWPCERPNESGDPADNSPTKEDIKGANCPGVVMLARERDDGRNEIADDENDQKHGNLRVAK